jgi:hypothetical protein
VWLAYLDEVLHDVLVAHDAGLHQRRDVVLWTDTKRAAREASGRHDGSSSALPTHASLYQPILPTVGPAPSR